MARGDGVRAMDTMNTLSLAAAVVEGMPLAAQRTLLERSDNAAARWSDCYSSWVRTLAPGKRVGPPPAPPAGAGAPRALLSPYARALLRAAYQVNSHPGPIARRELAAAAKCTARQVQVFFQNARQREKKLLAQVEASACHGAQY